MSGFLVPKIPKKFSWVEDSKIKIISQKSSKNKDFAVRQIGKDFILEGEDIIITQEIVWVIIMAKETGFPRGAATALIFNVEATEGVITDHESQGLFRVAFYGAELSMNNVLGLRGCGYQFYEQLKQYQKWVARPTIRDPNLEYVHGMIVQKTHADISSMGKQLKDDLTKAVELWRESFFGGKLDKNGNKPGKKRLH